MPHAESICFEETATYGHRVYNDNQHNFCSVHEKGFDAVLFVAIGVTATCLAPRKHYAIVMLILGALLQILNIEVNLHQLSNAFNLWIGITPAKTFFYIFLPPLLLDSAVRIDFFVFKKVMYQVFVLAFGVVACNTVLLAVFMLYFLNLRNEGWEWTDGFLFACMIASTDALAVTAIMKDGSGPESLIILAEGESLFNDATSIVFFDLFWPRFKDSVNGTLKHETIPKVVGGMALDVLRLATGGAAVGMASGFLTQLLFRFLQNRQGHTPVSEVGVTVGVAYLCYYVAESVFKFSGVIAVVVYGLYGAATTQWDISPSARESKVFSSFWDVTQLLTNGIVFFFAGASATNFFWRCEEDLFKGSDDDAWKTIFAWLPAVYIGIFALRFLEIVIVAPLVGYFGFKLQLKEMVFVSLAGLRGALALILAEELLQYEFPAEAEDGNDFRSERKVRAQSALWVCGFVLLTLIINAPGIPVLLKICGLQNTSPLQLKYREKSRQALHQYTNSTIKELKTDPWTILRGINWKSVEEFALGSLEDIKKAEAAPKPREMALDSDPTRIVDRRWELLETVSRRAPTIPTSTGNPPTVASFSEQESTVAIEEAATFGRQDEGKRITPLIQPPTSKGTVSQSTESTRSNGVVLASPRSTGVCFFEQFQNLSSEFMITMDSAQFPTQETTQKFFSSSSSYLNLVRRKTDLPSAWRDTENGGVSAPESSSQAIIRPSPTMSKAVSVKNPSISVNLLEAEVSDDADDEQTHFNQRLIEARFRMLMGLKKYFQQRRTDGFLSPKGLRYLQSACDKNMEEPESPLRIWDFVSADIKARLLTRFAIRLRHFIRQMEIVLRRLPDLIESMITPLLKLLAQGLSVLESEDMRLALEVAIEYWIGVNAYRSHSSWLIGGDGAEDIAAQIREQAQNVWIYILDREIESPERFEAVQSFRAKRAITYSQIAFVDDLFDCGLFEESEHEHLRHDLERKRTYLTRLGPVLHHFEIMEFLKNIPFFANVSAGVFRQVVSQCQLRQYNRGELILNDKAGGMDSFSFHIIVNGILSSSYTNSLGASTEFHLGRGGIFGLLSALSGEYYAFMGSGKAELNAMGNGPSVLTVPHSALMKIHAMATKGVTQYQQLELDLFRVAALYTVEIMKNNVLAALIGVYSEEIRQSKKHKIKQQKEEEKGYDGAFVRCLDGSPLSETAAPPLSSMPNPSEIVKESYAKAMNTLKQMKEGLLSGELVLLPADAKFLQMSSSVLLVGSLLPAKKELPSFVAPVVIPYVIPQDGITTPIEYVAGEQGAIVISCVDDETVMTRVNDGGMRCGEHMASMPFTAAHMHNEFFA